MDEILSRDQNHVTVLGAVTNDSDQDIRMLRVDPLTGRLLIAADFSGAAVTSLNGLTGAINLIEGSNITITVVGNDIEIAASGGGGGVTSITGTTNQVIASAATGAVTLSLPQDIATSSTPQFALIGIGTAAVSNIEETILQPVRTTGSPNIVKVTGGAHTTLTASTQASDIFFDLARSVQFSTGPLAYQGAFRTTAPTYTAVGATTITTAATVSISAAPTAGTNVTITNAYALDVVSGITHVGGQLAVNGGSQTSPAIYFDVNNTAGFFSSVTGTIGFTASGASRYTMNSTDIRSTGTGFILTRNLGTDGLMLSVTGDTNTGIGMPGSDVLNVITGGVIALQANATQQVKIRAGSSTGLLAAVGGIMNVNTTAVGNVGTGEDDLMTYSIPASTLGTNGASIRFRASGTIANNVNAKRIRVKYGGTTVLDTGAAGIPVSAAIQWVLEGEIIRTGATTQKCNANLSTNNATLASYVGYSTAAETLSGAVTLKLTGEAVANDDIVQETMTVSFVSAV